MPVPPRSDDRVIAYDYIRPPNRRSRYEGRLLDANVKRIVMTSRLSPSVPVVYRGEEVMGKGYDAVWFLFQGQPFDLARVSRPDGRFTGFYVDVLEPVTWRPPAEVAPITDLFLDLWIAPDGGYQVLDEDEFEDARRSGVITEPQAGEARRTLERVIAAIEDGNFPPDWARDFVP